MGIKEIVTKIEEKLQALGLTLPQPPAETACGTTVG